MNNSQNEINAVEQVLADEHRAITFLNMSGDITLTWDERHDEKIKALVRDQMAKGVTFFTMRKVVIDKVKVRRKVGEKGVDKIDNLVIDDEAFEKLVNGVNDRELAETLRSGVGSLAKRREDKKSFKAISRAKTPEDVIASRQAVAVRKVVGG